MSKHEKHWELSDQLRKATYRNTLYEKIYIALSKKIQRDPNVTPTELRGEARMVVMNETPDQRFVDSVLERCMMKLRKLGVVDSDNRPVSNSTVLITIGERAYYECSTPFVLQALKRDDVAFFFYTDSEQSHFIDDSPVEQISFSDSKSQKSTPEELEFERNVQVREIEQKKKAQMLAELEVGNESIDQESSFIGDSNPENIEDLIYNQKESDIKKKQEIETINKPQKIQKRERSYTSVNFSEFGDIVVRNKMKVIGRTITNNEDTMLQIPSKPVFFVFNCKKVGNSSGTSIAEYMNKLSLFLKLIETISPITGDPSKTIDEPSVSPIKTIIFLPFKQFYDDQRSVDSTINKVNKIIKWNETKLIDSLMQAKGAEHGYQFVKWSTGFENSAQVLETIESIVAPK